MTIVPLRGVKRAPEEVRSRMETMLLTPEIVQKWQVPPFQRRLRINAKVEEIAAGLRENGGIISGMLTLGQLPNDETFYLMDGQHRREAGLLSGLPEFIADVRIQLFKTMAEMAKEYVKLNSNIVKMMPDDVLRGMEGSVPSLAIIRRRCPFVSYSYVRSSTETLLGMAATIRAWHGSAADTPNATRGLTAIEVAEEMTVDNAEGLCDFLLVAKTAWGDDVENFRLWSALNLTMCMWMWRVLVIADRKPGRIRISLKPEQFKRCLMQISADRDYVSWLAGRSMSERDRSPCYKRLRIAFVRRLNDEGVPSVKMPSPSWYTT